MWCTFSEEPNFGEDATSQDYVLELLSEEVVDNVNYQKVKEFTQPTAKDRFATRFTTGGRIAVDFTYANEAWTRALACLVGSRIRLAGHALAGSSEHWPVVTGMLAGNIDSSQTGFTITEYKTGEFDNVVGVIVNNEYLTVGAITNGVVTGAARGQGTTTAAPHAGNALVYGVVADASSKLDIIKRNRDGFVYTLPTSLTFLIYRLGEYFKFNGVQFPDFVLNANPTQGVDTSFELKGKYSDIISIANPSSTHDDGVLVDTDHMSVYSMNTWLDMAKMYFQITNSLAYAPTKFFDTTTTGFINYGMAAYGQFSPVDDGSDFYNQYRDDDSKNLSLTISNSKTDFTHAFVFAFNNTRWGTPLRVLRTTRLIHPSIPFYTYGPEEFTIIIQSET